LHPNHTVERNSRREGKIATDDSTPVPAIGPWVASTIAAPDVDAVEKTYVDWLGFRVVQRGTLDASVAASWGAPKNSGASYSILEPESGKQNFLRIVHNPKVEGYKPLTTFGWAASEMVCQDVDALQERLKDSPFEIVGPAADLEMIPEIRAMQVRGLADEIFYLTMFKVDIPEYDLPVAHSFVDRMFIAVLATNCPEKVQGWFEKHWGIAPGDIADTKLSLIDDAFGVPPRTLDLRLTVTTMRSRSLVEIDGYPPQATVRPQDEGYLPPGNAMMSVAVDTLDGLALDTITNPVLRPEAPYFGRRAATTIGAMGELIELVERDPS
jgi:catechol 2,3-dioxygenase-like lactoylglutathione lyase family enzyme